MTNKQLVQYIVNNDLEYQVIRGDAQAIQEVLYFNGFDYPLEVIETAINQCLSDPYIVKFAEQLI